MNGSRRLSSLMVMGGLVLAVIIVVSLKAPAQVRPAVVKNIDEPGRIPYQQHVAAAKASANCGGNFCDFLLPTVPAGKRLVITNFSGHLAFEGTAVAGRIVLYLDSLTAGSPEFEVPHNPGAYHKDPISIGNPNRMAFNEKVQLFVEAGQRPLIDLHTDGRLVDDWKQVFIVTGYLVDLTY